MNKFILFSNISKIWMYIHVMIFKRGKFVFSEKNIMKMKDGHTKKKKVMFAKYDEIFFFIDEHKNDRIPYWQQFTVDRMRFARRITHIEKLISPYLDEKYRENIYNKRYK